MLIPRSSEALRLSSPSGAQAQELWTVSVPVPAAIGVRAGVVEGRAMASRSHQRDATDALGRSLYSLICSRDGITAREMACVLGVERKAINQRLYTYPFIRDLCYHDEEYRWHGLIRQRTPHEGLYEYSGWYGTAAEFMLLDEATWLEELRAGCARIGRSLNDTRGLIHSFRDCRQVMRETFAALADFDVACDGWELAFELRIKRAKWVRIYADVLVIVPEGPSVPSYAFSLEFKMKGAIDPSEVAQAAKYVPYLEVVLGPRTNVVPALVLTQAQDRYEHVGLAGGGELPVASGDMLFNVFDEYLGFLD